MERELVALQCHTLRRPNNGPNTGAIRKLNINKSYIMVTMVSLIQFCLEQGRHYPSLLWRSQLKLILDVHKYTTSHSVLCGSWDGNISMERTVTIQPSLQVTVWSDDEPHHLHHLWVSLQTGTDIVLRGPCDLSRPTILVHDRTFLWCVICKLTQQSGETISHSALGSSSAR